MKRVREEDRVSTVTPSMARDSQFPAAAIEAWNRMILSNFSDGLAVVSKLAVAKSLGWLNGANKHPAWLRPKEHFEKFGWRVEDDTDGDTLYFREVLPRDMSIRLAATAKRAAGSSEDNPKIIDQSFGPTKPLGVSYEEWSK